VIVVCGVAGADSDESLTKKAITRFDRGSMSAMARFHLLAGSKLGSAVPLYSHKPACTLRRTQKNQQGVNEESVQQSEARLSGL
jgi:hypothetical protein